MVDQDSTKAKIVLALTEILKNHSLDEITVGIVAEAANVSRQTFYYHFSNLTKVYLWAVSSKMRYGLTEYAGFIALDPADYIIDVCHAMKANCILTNAFIDSQQIEVLDALRDYFYSASRASLLYVIGDTRDSKELDLLAQFLAGGDVGIVFKWLREGMKDDISELIHSIFNICRGTMSPDIIQRIGTTEP